MSEIAENIIDRGKQLADAACQKGIEVVEKTKLSVKIQDAKLKAKARYEKLGRIVYKRIKKGIVDPDTEMKTAVIDIDEANDRIELLNRAMRELKGAVVCPKCGALNPEKAKFCTECAAPVKE